MNRNKIKNLTDKELFVIWCAVCQGHRYPFTQTLKTKIYDLLGDKKINEIRHKNNFEERIDDILNPRP